MNILKILIILLLNSICKIHCGTSSSIKDDTLEEDFKKNIIGRMNIEDDNKNYIQLHAPADIAKNGRNFKYNSLLDGKYIMERYKLGFYSQNYDEESFKNRHEKICTSIKNCIDTIKADSCIGHDNELILEFRMYVPKNIMNDQYKDNFQTEKQQRNLFGAVTRFAGGDTYVYYEPQMIKDNATNKLKCLNNPHGLKNKNIDKVYEKFEDKLKEEENLIILLNLTTSDFVFCTIKKS